MLPEYVLGNQPIMIKRSSANTHRLTRDQYLHKQRSLGHLESKLDAIIVPLFCFLLSNNTWRNLCILVLPSTMLPATLSAVNCTCWTLGHNGIGACGRNCKAEERWSCKGIDPIVGSEWPGYMRGCRGVNWSASRPKPSLSFIPGSTYNDQLLGHAVAACYIAIPFSSNCRQYKMGGICLSLKSRASDTKDHPSTLVSWLRQPICFYIKRFLHHSQDILR